MLWVEVCELRSEVWDVTSVIGGMHWEVCGVRFDVGDVRCLSQNEDIVDIKNKTK